MTMKELQQEIIANMKNWQNAENDSVASTAQILKKTGNPVIRLVMEVIQRDSLMHHRVQEFIADSLEYKTVSLSPDELTEVWDMIEHHNELEKKMVGNTEQMVSHLKGTGINVVIKYLLNYLMEDEKKHKYLLDSLDNIKHGMLP
ncbi:MAG TPA: hypothetical protein VMV84_03985 [Dehalococcoidales bacterium]|nr:hypothetical protein [Dehalococcoidales bacterium]